MVYDLQYDTNQDKKIIKALMDMRVPWGRSQWHRTDIKMLTDDFKDFPEDIVVNIELSNIYTVKMNFSQILFDECARLFPTQQSIKKPNYYSELLGFAFLWCVTFLHEFLGHFFFKTSSPSIDTSVLFK